MPLSTSSATASPSPPPLSPAFPTSTFSNVSVSSGMSFNNFLPSKAFTWIASGCCRTLRGACRYDHYPPSGSYVCGNIHPARAARPAIVPPRTCACPAPSTTYFRAFATSISTPRSPSRMCVGLIRSILSPFKHRPRITETHRRYSRNTRYPKRYLTASWAGRGRARGQIDGGSLCTRGRRFRMDGRMRGGPVRNAGSSW